MDAKTYLNRIQKIDILIKNKSAEVEQWRNVALGTTVMTNSEAVQSSGNKQKMADAVSKYTDIENEICELAAEKDAIIKTIEQLPTDEYDLLHKLYVQGMPLKAIAVFKKRTYSWATTKHTRAVKRIQGILDKRGV